MKSFDSLFELALRKHGEAELNTRLPNAKSASVLVATEKAALAACHDAFARWRDESGRPWCEISIIAACAV